MVILIILVWYLIGSVGGFFLFKKQFSNVTIGDIVFIFTIGGAVGLFTVLILLLIRLQSSNWWNKPL